MVEEITIKATEDAPNIVAQGHLVCENVNGEFVTDDRKFANWMIDQGYGHEFVQDFGYPEDFPAKAKLENSGISLEQLATLDESKIGEIEGIGAKTVTAILAALEATGGEGESE